jgi:hypothetical protein
MSQNGNISVVNGNDLVQSLNEVLNLMPDNKKGAAHLNRKVQTIVRQIFDKIDENGQKILLNDRFKEIFSRFASIKHAGGFQRVFKSSKTERALTLLFHRWIKCKHDIAFKSEELPKDPTRGSDFNSAIKTLKKKPTNELIKELNVRARGNSQRSIFIETLKQLFSSNAKALTCGISPEIFPEEFKKFLKEKSASMRPVFA